MLDGEHLVRAPKICACGACGCLRAVVGIVAVCFSGGWISRGEAAAKECCFWKRTRKEFPSRVTSQQEEDH